MYFEHPLLTKILLCGTICKISFLSQVMTESRKVLDDDGPCPLVVSSFYNLEKRTTKKSWKYVSMSDNVQQHKNAFAKCYWNFNQEGLGSLGCLEIEYTWHDLQCHKKILRRFRIIWDVLDSSRLTLEWLNNIWLCQFWSPWIIGRDSEWDVPRLSRFRFQFSWSIFTD